MKKLAFAQVTAVVAFVLLGGGSACGGTPAGEATTTEALPTANADGIVLVTPTPNLASDVPILPDAFEMKINADGTDISYKVAISFDEAVKAYQDQLESLGWERKSKKDSGFATNITLLRFKSDANLSVTIQKVAGSEELIIRITRLPK